MDVLARALELEGAGHHVCHLEVGQPQSGAPSKVSLPRGLKKLSASCGMRYVMEFHLWC